MLKPDVIAWFDGTEHDFLSNFHASPIRAYDELLDGFVDVPTVEHGFQADKTVDFTVRKRILGALDPGLAKQLGRRCSLREDWETIKIGRMHNWLRLKFAIPDLQRQLLATGDAVLIEGNSWGDRVWGQVDGIGQNWLGRLLMNVRAEIRETAQCR
jgi:ribA/ribD-fused uncharacterized protein